MRGAPRRLRLLLSCRDPNGAQQIVPLVHEADAGGAWEIVVVADAPGIGVLRSAGIEAEEAGIGAVASGDRSGRQMALTRATELLGRFTPDAVIACSSGPNAGIDEALVAAAGPVRSFVLQDSWGDVNEIFGATAGHYFVLDRVAAEATKPRVGARLIESGMPKYDAYCEFDTRAQRESTQRKLGTGDRTLISFFAQPLAEMPGYTALLHSAIDAAASLGKAVQFVMRPHPKDSSGLVADAMGHATSLGVDSGISAEGTAESLIAASDIVVSAYSMCCYDAIMLAACTPHSSSAAIYFMTDEIWAAYRASTRLDHVLPARAGLALLARSPQELRAHFALACKRDYRDEVGRRIRATVPPPGGAARRILDHVAAALDGTPSRQRMAARS